MAAAGFDKRSSSASSLQTPGSGSFPSEMCSPLTGSPGFLKKDELKTPITPPSAYLDFLNKMSPAMMSPAPTSTSSRFNFGEKTSAPSSAPGSQKHSITPPLTAPLPPMSRNTSYDSQTSTTSNVSQQSATSQSSSNGTLRSRPQSPRVIIPPSPFAKPAAPRSARTPRLRIPQSPFTPAIGSAQSVPSPYSTTPVSAAPWSASFSPREPIPETTNGKMSVRQVVTRTVTYCRTPLDPAPKGKRRKIEVEDLGSKSSSEEPPIKEEEKEDEDITPSTAQPVEPPPRDTESMDHQ
ncbi:uncharacterized protein LTR77_010151 [Saxophila tyrrhenica]|uniref:Uncharacterized protein n=1 Tax=Saxophila tyrrhenica TaxID=1690608 RepID=A0AAV9NWK4_9PEZI|nr:hypothetical protein LTR77_010151 [Saxophila tyrrhenica]